MVQIDHLRHRIERTPKSQVGWRYCPLSRASLHSDHRHAEHQLAARRAAGANLAPPEIGPASRKHSTAPALSRDPMHAVAAYRMPSGTIHIFLILR
jgi:hypothetical protein